MKYAIISDVHGNLPALDLVINDARSENVDAFIFAGDYFLSNPFPNECMNRIRSIENKYIIRGNEEAYLEKLIGKSQSTWTDGQMQISYYCYRAVSQDNLNYVLSLPHNINFSDKNVDIFISHSSAEFIDDCEHKEWNTANLASKYQTTKLTPDMFRNDIQKYFDMDNKFQCILKNLNPGVYIFGHSHIQWNWHSEDGRITLINPGSCGLPLDGIKNSIPYTILEIREDGHVSVEEKRLPFEMEEYINIHRNSDQYKYATVWTKIIEKELRTGFEHLYFFLHFVEDYANKIGDARRPYALDTWETAYALWEVELTKEIRSL